MTVDILVSIQTAWNHKLQAKGYSTLLLTDNARCRQRDYQCQFSTINVVYLPPHSTSVVQALDLGIIRNTKVNYRKYRK